MVKVILSVPEYVKPERSDPETVADTIPLVVVDTVQGYIHTADVDEAVIITLLTSPVILIVGDAAIASLKVAVIVTTSDPETKFSGSTKVKVTLGKKSTVVIKPAFVPPSSAKQAPATNLVPSLLKLTDSPK